MISSFSSDDQLVQLGWSAHSARMISSFSSYDQLKLIICRCRPHLYVKSTEIEKISISWMEKDDAITSTLFIIVKRDWHQVKDEWLIIFKSILRSAQADHPSWTNWSSSCGRTLADHNIYIALIGHYQSMLSYMVKGPDRIGPNERSEGSGVVALCKGMEMLSGPMEKM